MLMLLVAVLVMASVASADTFRFMQSGNWEDSQWQNQTQGLTNVAPPTSTDVARMNWANGTCTLSTATEVYRLMTGVDESGNLVVANGGFLTTGVTWSAIGNNGLVTGTLTVQTGGTVDFGQHLWVGNKAGATGIVDIDGGTVNVGQMLGLGWGGGIGYVNVNDGGVLDLFQLHGDGTSSIKNGSILDITGTGKVLLPGNYTSVINAYVANGTIYGNGVLGNIAIDVTDGVTTITAIYIDPDAPSGEASNPNPANAADGVNSTPILSWTPGDFVQALNEHDVYFGETFNDVNDANSADHPNVTYENRDVNNFDPGALEFGKTYYWRVDEVNDANVAAPWKGQVWDFTTDDHVVVEDFEFYDWDRQLGADANWVYYVWVDGLANFLYLPDMGGNDTGANIFTQYATVLGGLQAMRFDYDNDGFAENPRLGGQLPRLHKWSKAKAQIANLPSGVGSDWVANGIRALSISFYGDSLNDIEPMWVELTDSTGGLATVTYGDHAGENPSDIAEASWHEWLIDLQEFSDGGLDLADVNSIAIGFGTEGNEDGGGYGFVYFDDIALYPLRCVRKPLLSEGNFNDDCAIDFRDFAIMAENYLIPGMFPQSSALPD